MKPGWDESEFLFRGLPAAARFRFLPALLALALGFSACCPGPAGAQPPADAQEQPPSANPPAASPGISAYVPRGPSVCYRYLCPDYNLVGCKPDQYFTRADPVEYAQFCQQLNLDAALLLAVPTEGYCAYPSRVGTPFPNQKPDWFQRTIDQLHRRSIAGFAYVTLGWNLKYAREHPEFMAGDTLCFNSPYLDLVLAYHREILSRYPVDGIRNDIFWQSMKCHCAGCRAYYRELFGEALPQKWDEANWRRREQFRDATIVRAARRIYQASKEVKPSVEVWQNQLNIHHGNNSLEALRYADAVYMEFGDPFGLLFHLGLSPNKPVIVGKLENLAPKQMHLCMALGARGYTYIKSLGTTALPPATEAEGEAFRQRNGWTSGGARQNARSRGEIMRMLGPFYHLIAQIQPYLEGAKPVYHCVGVVYGEATRYRYPNANRTPYTKVLKELAELYLARSLPVRFLDGAVLAGTDLSPFSVLVLPETSGLEADQVKALLQYARAGGHLILAGGALRYDKLGLPLPASALPEELRFPSPAGEPAKIQRRLCGRGQIVCIAEDYTAAGLPKVIDSFAGGGPVTLASPQTTQVVFTRQESRRRWILHVLSEGDCTVSIDPSYAPVHKAVPAFPASGWRVETTPAATGLTLRITGNGQNRVVVLE